jgi:hypothetical protein
MDIRDFFGAKPGPPKKASSSKPTIPKSDKGDNEKPPVKSRVLPGDEASKASSIKTICRDKILASEVEKPPEYRFHVHVREGAPGFSDDDSYDSPSYATFEECYKKCVLFKPEAHWTHHRYTQSVSMSKNKGQHVPVISTAQGCGLIDVDHLDHLGITEAQFDHVIWELERAL